MSINVIKRDGGSEALDIVKIHKVIEWAINGYKGVSKDEIEINSRLNIRDGISTEEIHNVLIETAANLISLESPNYQWVAGRLLNYHLRKKVWGGKNPPRLLDVIKSNVSLGVYDKTLLEAFSESEINKFGEIIDHDRDFLFTYAGIKQLTDKYLVRNRYTKQYHETPQFAYMCIAMMGFSRYSGQERVNYIKKAYNAFSKHKINLPTPICAGLRTPLRSYSSCMLLGIGDNKESLTASATAISLATAARYGIGFNMGEIRPAGAPVRGGDVVHTGLTPFLKIYESSCKAWQQSSCRGGSGNCNIPWFHYEVQEVIVLKNNAGTDDNRVRKLDYTVGLTRLFYERVQKNETITLFNPHEVPELWLAYGLEHFDEIYLKCEKNEKLKFRKVIPARQLASLIVKERTETGRIYIFNADTANQHGTFDVPVQMVNLCTEVIHPVIEIKDTNDEKGEIGICTLGAINALEVKSNEEWERVCDVLVRFLEEILDIQEYFMPAAERFAKNWRSLGIGLSNVAAYIAYNSLKYSSEETPNLIDEISEKLSYFCIKASIELAKEKEPLPYFFKTKWSKGVLPIDTYKKAVDKVVTRKPSFDWEVIRKDVRTYGIRHSTLLSMMPVESSSVIQNSTNGCEPVRSKLTFKESKEGSIKLLVPGAGKWHSNYELAFQIGDNTPLINVMAAIQKWTCMGMSVNLYYDYSRFPDKALPDAVVLKDIFYAYKMGLKTLYYSITNDSDKQDEISSEVEESVCTGGGCSL